MGSKDASSTLGSVKFTKSSASPCSAMGSSISLSTARPRSTHRKRRGISDFASRTIFKWAVDVLSSCEPLSPHCFCNNRNSPIHKPVSKRNPSGCFFRIPLKLKLLESTERRCIQRCTKATVRNTLLVPHRRLGLKSSTKTNGCPFMERTRSEGQKRIGKLNRDAHYHHS